MDTRPVLEKGLSGKTFRSFYYLKEELVEFCRANGLSTLGGKVEITERVAHFLDTGEALSVQTTARPKAEIGVITADALIEPNFVCSERHRAFFRTQIGVSFSFPVAFQKWLKSNTGKTYAQAIEAYHQIMAEKKTGKTVIDKQFEYNTYIRDFFADNHGKTLEQAILCWKHKKAMPGHNRYESADLSALDIE